MLHTSILPAIRTLFGNDRFYFQQDGTPPHFHRDVRAYLNENLPGQWIGRRGAVECPPRSPDLTFRHRASCILGQAFRYSPENAFYICNQQIYFII